MSLAGANPAPVSDSKVSLTLAAAVAAGDAVRVSYAKPNSNWLQNLACGKEAEGFSDVSVTNLTP